MVRLITPREDQTMRPPFTCAGLRTCLPARTTTVLFRRDARLLTIVLPFAMGSQNGMPHFRLLAWAVDKHEPLVHCFLCAIASRCLTWLTPRLERDGPSTYSDRCIIVFSIYYFYILSCMSEYRVRSVPRLLPAIYSLGVLPRWRFHLARPRLRNLICDSRAHSNFHFCSKNHYVCTRTHSRGNRMVVLCGVW